ncbi:hypothetical protein BLNAU_191 [Blattamonas nauphoetae]|uniref:Uncharacterized protein n=1 Tax=Blattamonas nauphoetae TaxID=2049346 RepID=A0ABQ9YM98_9EUKA|nr:hypothetical protein BLNAU_191 [Blattamonas nauphoetae]
MPNARQTNLTVTFSRVTKLQWRLLFQEEPLECQSAFAMSANNQVTRQCSVHTSNNTIATHASFVDNLDISRSTVLTNKDQVEWKGESLIHASILALTLITLPCITPHTVTALPHIIVLPRLTTMGLQAIDGHQEPIQTILKTATVRQPWDIHPLEDPFLHNNAAGRSPLEEDHGHRLGKTGMEDSRIDRRYAAIGCPCVETKMNQHHPM